MTDSNPVEDSIRHSITKNGFPEKVVRLPFKPVYDSCKKNGTALADVLDRLKAEDILGTMEGDYIVFRSPEKAAEAAQAREANSGEKARADDSAWWSRLSGMGDLSALAQEAMAQMTPEQLQEVRQKIENMSEEEKKNIIQMMSQFTQPSRNK